MIKHNKGITELKHKLRDVRAANNVLKKLSVNDRHTYINNSLIYYGLDTRHFSDGRKAPTQAPTVLLF